MYTIISCKYWPIVLCFIQKHRINSKIIFYRLRASLQRLSDANINNIDWTVIGSAVIDFDDFRFSTDGVRSLEANSKALRDLKASSNTRNCAIFRGPWSTT